MTSHCVTSGGWRLPGAPLLFRTRPWEPLARTVSWSLSLGLNRSHLPPLGRVRITFKTQIWSRSLSTLASCLRGLLTVSPARLSHPPVWLPSSGTCRRLQGFLGGGSPCVRPSRKVSGGQVAGLSRAACSPVAAEGPCRQARGPSVIPRRTSAQFLRHPLRA